VAVGDVVYMMEKDDDNEFCKIEIVQEVKPGEDGNIRTATVQYTNPGGDPHSRSPPKLAVRPFHKLAVTVHVDYRFEEDLEGADSKGPESRPGPRQVGPPRGDGILVECQTGNPKGETKEGSSPKGSGRLKKGGRNRPRQGKKAGPDMPRGRSPQLSQGQTVEEMQVQFGYSCSAVG
jgi:hypothetical protein